jgi:YVTN family beta-propeller protein
MEGKYMKKIKSFTLVLIAVIGLILSGCKSSDADSVSKREEVKETVKTEFEETQADKFFFTANEGGSISKINAADNKLVDEINVDGLVHNVQVSPDGKMLGATLIPASGDDHDDGHGHGEDAKGKVLFYNTETNELMRKVEVGNHPAHIVFTNNKEYALVTNNEDHNVSVIDMETFTVQYTIPTGKGPHGFRISSDSKFAYVANMSEDTVSVVNLETMKEDKKITVGKTPVTTALTADGKWMVATLHTENALVAVNLDTGEIEKVEVGIGPAQVYIGSEDEHAYVANQGTEESPSQSMSVVDFKNNTVVSTIETGKGAHGVVTSADNKFAYITNMFEDTVSVIDLETEKVVETFEVGEIPNGITIME